MSEAPEQHEHGASPRRRGDLWRWRGVLRSAHGRSESRHTLIPLRSRPVRRYQGAACRTVPIGPLPGRVAAPRCREAKRPPGATGLVCSLKANKNSELQNSILASFRLFPILRLPILRAAQARKKAGTSDSEWLLR